MDPVSQPIKHDPYAALKIKEFRLFLTARFCLVISLHMQQVIVGWQVYEITDDPFSLGLIGLCEAIPFLIVALFAGHVADMVNRKKIIILVLISLFICSAGLLYLTLDFIPSSLKNNPAPIYILIFITGIGRGFIGPALFAFMPQIINDRKLYSNAISWNSSMWQTGAILGPSLAGIIYGIGKLSAVYTTVTILILLSFLLFTRIASRPLPLSEIEESVEERLLAGVKFVFNNQLILSAISLDLFAVFFGGAVALLPVFASEILKVGAEGLGFLRAAPGIGAVLMLILLAYFPVRKKAGIKMLWAVGGFGVCIVLFGLSQNLWFSIALLVLSGAFDSISIIVRSTLIHTLTPENMKGRVSSINNIFIGSSNELGAFESGALAKIIGVVPAVVSGGLITLGIAGFTAIKAKKLRELNL
ncbi:MAG: MFS transporter [Cytophagaceae bacterium]|nr:MFS transporter [Cytophagaceae bacterium]